MPSTSFHEIRKNGYIDKTQKKVSTRQAIREGLKELKQEIKNWTAEIKEGAMMDPIMSMPLPGRTFQMLSFEVFIDPIDFLSRGSGCTMVFQSKYKL